MIFAATSPTPTNPLVTAVRTRLTLILVTAVADLGVIARRHGLDPSISCSTWCILEAEDIVGPRRDA